MYTSDNSLTERLNRIVREKDASNWLTGELREEIKNIPFKKNSAPLSDDENQKVSGVFGDPKGNRTPIAGMKTRCPNR